MPEKQKHIEQAEHNHSFWQSLDVTRTDYLDWIVIGMFYEAVHWVEAFLASTGHHSRNHHERETKIAKTPALTNAIPDLAADYGLLRTDSENARYWNYKHTASQISSELVPVATRLRNTVRALL